MVQLGACSGPTHYTTPQKMTLFPQLVEAISCSTYGRYNYTLITCSLAGVFGPVGQDYGICSTKKCSLIHKSSDHFSEQLLADVRYCCEYYKHPVRFPPTGSRCGMSFLAKMAFYTNEADWPFRNKFQSWPNWPDRVLRPCDSWWQHTYSTLANLK